MTETATHVATCPLLTFFANIYPPLTSRAQENKLKDLKFPFSLKELQELDATIMVLARLNPWALFGFFATLYVMYVDRL